MCTSWKTFPAWQEIQATPPLTPKEHLELERNLHLIDDMYETMTEDELMDRADRLYDSQL